MNFLSHLALASADGLPPVSQYGAMAPDLFAMAGVRSDYASAGTEFAMGVRHHKAVDRRFHSHALFSDACRHLSEELVGAGQDRHVSALASHVAIELAIDGLLPAPSEVCWQLAMSACATSEGVERDDTQQARWSGYVQRLSADGPPNYSDRSVVVDRTIAVLQRRPRIAMRVKPDTAQLLRNCVESEHFMEVTDKLQSDLFARSPAAPRNAGR